MNLLLLSNPILNAYRGSDLFGKAIFLALLFLSIITWTLFIQKFFLQREVTQRGSQLMQLFQKKRVNPLGMEVGEALHPFAAIYRTLKEHTLELLQKNHSVVGEKGVVTLSATDIDLIEAHLMTAVSAEAKGMEKNLFVLATIVSLSPFLGLLGTVWGILLTFAELQTGAAANANATVMGGLGHGLGNYGAGPACSHPCINCL